MFGKRIGLILLGLILISPNAFSEAIPLAPQAPATEITPPKVEPLSPSKKEYTLGEVLVYQVQLTWSNYPEGIRLNSPEVSTDNLEFLGVSQETVNSGNQNQFTQLLNFKFGTKQSGEAKVNRFELNWTYNDGLQTLQSSIPGLEINVKKPLFIFSRLFLLILLGLGGLIAAVVGLLAVKKNKKTVTAINSPNLIEETSLKELDKAREESGSKNTSFFLSELNRIFSNYLTQKLGWNPSKASYNEFQKTLEEKWSKKEGELVKEILDQLQYLKYSEGDKDQGAVNQLYYQIYKFIEGRKIS